MTTVIVQDQNNVTVEVTPQPPINVVIDRGVSGPPGPPGDGDVNGPASSIAANVVTFADTTGKLIQDSGKAIPSGEIVGTTDTQPLTNKTIAYDSNTMTGVQPTLVSGTSIKTVNSNSLLGSGNVSVGDVVGPASSTDNAIARFDGATGKLIQNSAVTIADDGTTVIDVSSASAALRITQTGAGNALVVEDSTNPDGTPFVVDSNGTVIVGGAATYTTSGITTPPLNIVTASSGAGIGVSGWVGATAGAPNFQFMKSRGASIGTHTVVADGDTLGIVRFAGSDGTNFISAANITGAVDGTPGTNDMPGRLVFSTTADGASTPTERMRIDAAGRIGIGAAASAGINLYLARNVTGATTSYGIAQSAAIQSDVTANAYLNNTLASTQAAAFTLTNLSYNRVAQGAIGAGSSVTNQYGFEATSSLTGATNNYGFYSNIASGTGRWNFYANGTAANYFAGSTTFADATAPVISAKIGPSSSQQHTLPAVASDTITLNAATQTLTNKTLTAPVISTISNTGTLTLPTSTDTLVGRATTDTLTNKTITFANNTLTGVQPTLVSGTSIKTINGNSLLGSGDLVISTGTGDVVGPASAVSGNVATFNGITGKVIQDGGKALPTGAIVGTTDSQALSGKTYNGLTLTSAVSGFTVAGGTTSKTLTVSNTLTLAGTDESTLNIGGGGTLGSAAFTASTAYAPATSGTAILKGNGTGGTASATAGTDYLAPPTGTALLKANSGGALADAVANTDYVAPAGADGLLSRWMFQDTGWDWHDSGTTNALNYINGSVQRWSPTAASSPTLTISSWPPSGAMGELLIEGINLGAAGTITFPTANWVKSDGTFAASPSAAGVTLQSSGTDFILFWTRDAGTTLYAKVVR